MQLDPLRRLGQVNGVTRFCEAKTTPWMEELESRLDQRSKRDRMSVKAVSEAAASAPSLRGRPPSLEANQSRIE